MAPGPGRSAAPFTVVLLVAAMQNTEASVALAGVPVVTAPAATPVSVIVRQAVLPKQPTWVPVPWPGQNRPVAMLVLAGPVVSGARVTPIAPACPPSQQPWLAPQRPLQGTPTPAPTPPPPLLPPA